MMARWNMVCCLGTLLPLMIATTSVVEGLLKGMDDSVMFRIDWRLATAMPGHLFNLKGSQQHPTAFDNQPFVFISSGSDEQYLCAVPDVSAESKRKIDSYSGPSPAQLIRPLYDERVCSYWLDLYWTYELCHGRYVLQYHEDKESLHRQRSEFYLGNFRSDYTKMDDKAFDQLNPPTRKLDDVDLPYYPVTYRQGTVCDVTGKPRTTTVIYVCRLDAKDQVYSFAEISSCTYEMVVITRRLCAHPSFQPIIAPQHEIVCYSRNLQQKRPKPNALIALEREHHTGFEKEFSLIPPNGFYSTMSSGSLVEEGEEEEEEEDDDSDTTIILPKQTSSQTTDDSSSKRSRWAKSGKSNTKAPAPSSSSSSSSSSSGHHQRPSFVTDNDEFVRGKQCLYGGGSGWWKYEFCYGKHVTQYHVDPKGGRTEIVLGVFNEDVHKQWIRQNPQKQPLKIDGQVILASHIYTGGDVCEEENIHRSVEVRIRCRPSDGSQSAVTLFLLEPHTCQYVLGVESPWFCDLLQTVDEYGLLPVKP